MSSFLAPIKNRISTHTILRFLKQVNRVRALFLAEPYRTVLPYSMCSLSRLRSLDRLASCVDEEQIAGDIVECGVCNGGSAAILANRVCRSSEQRHVWLLDSFAGLPPAGDKDGPDAARWVGACYGRPNAVRDVLQRVGARDDAFTLVPGWFNDTVPSLPVERIALLHIDADWYESVLVVLEHLYDKVSPGGYIVFDDFHYWKGCRKAFEEFFGRRNIQPQVHPVDGIAVYIRKDLLASCTRKGSERASAAEMPCKTASACRMDKPR
jgi:O-methyltransferase